MSSEFALNPVEVATTPQQRFEEFLQSRGKRLTKQRQILLDTIFARHEHFDADALVEELRRIDKLGDVSRPTVYRTLKELTEAGLLRQMVLGGRAVYEHDYGYPQHDHLHCQRCDKLIEFQSPELAALRDAVAREHQFRVAGHRFIIQGVCDDCRRQRRQKRPHDLL